MHSLSMKKIIFILLSLISMIMLLIIPTYAYNDILNEVNIEVQLLEDGSASFTEKWITEVGSGTENYKVFNNMGDSKITNFSVVDETGHQFDYVDNWDINQSRSQKKYKCGIVERSNSYELCWGVGDYGHREYTIQYTISNFIQQYTNDQGFNYAFLSDMDLAPQKVYVKVSSYFDLTDEISDIYAFGFEGDVQFKEGSVYLETSSALSSYSKVQLLMRIDNGTFEYAYENGQDYNDILEDAKKGSDYTSDNDDDNYHYTTNNTGRMLFILYGVVGFNIFIYVALFVLAVQSRRRANLYKNSIQFEDQTNSLSLKKNKDIPMYRDIPCRKDLYYFYYAALCGGLITTDEKAGLIAAVLLQWIKDKKIEFIKTKDKGFLFKKEGYSIDLNVPIQTSCSVENELLNMLRQAAGSNGILETNEFEKWCKKHYSKVDMWFNRVNSFMESWLTNEGMLDRKNIPYRSLFATRYRIQRIYSVAFKEDINHVIGFKKFLQEMSLMDEKEVIEVELWEEYLIFATILGIADEVEKQLKIRCPEFDEISYMETVYTTRIMRDFTYRSVYAAHRAQSAASSGGSSRSSGGGGHSSSSGGGSHYSGGGGGGRR